MAERSVSFSTPSGEYVFRCSLTPDEALLLALVIFVSKGDWQKDVVVSIMDMKRVKTVSVDLSLVEFRSLAEGFLSKEFYMAPPHFSAFRTTLFKSVRVVGARAYFEWGYGAANMLAYHEHLYEALVLSLE